MCSGRDVELWYGCIYRCVATLLIFTMVLADVVAVAAGANSLANEQR